MKNKKVLVVAAGDSQCFLIKKAKALGLTVISTDRNPRSPGFALSDFHGVIDITDLEGTLGIARKFKVDAVLTDQTDVSVPTVAYVAEKLGLVGIGYDVAQNATNKFRMRKVCQQAGIPIPRFELVDNSTDALEAADMIGYPVIIKPVDNQGSRGVFVISEPVEISNRFREILNFSHEKKVLIEEKIKGVESTIEGFVVKGEAHVLGISEKTHIPPPYCISKSILYAPSFPQNTLEQLRELNKKAVRAIGIPHGMTHTEFIVSDEGPKLIEVAARGGGSRISSVVVPALSGVDVTEKLIYQSLGQDVQLEPRFEQKVLLEFLVFPPGTITALKGADIIRKIPELIDFYFPYNLGDHLTLVTSDPERHGQFIVAANTRQQLLDISHIINHSFKVTIQP